MLLERRASALADAADVALEALDLALYNWTSAERATLVATPAAADLVDRGAIGVALGVD